MNLAAYEEIMLRHRHSDGSWSRLEPRTDHHGPVEHDTERAWTDGRIFACTTCDEQVVVATTRSGETDRS